MDLFLGYRIFGLNYAVYLRGRFRKTARKVHPPCKAPYNMGVFVTKKCFDRGNKETSELQLAFAPSESPVASGLAEDTKTFNHYERSFQDIRYG